MHRSIFHQSDAQTAVLAGLESDLKTWIFQGTKGPALLSGGGLVQGYLKATCLGVWEAVGGGSAAALSLPGTAPRTGTGRAAVEPGGQRVGGREERETNYFLLGCGGGAPFASTLTK